MVKLSTLRILRFIKRTSGGYILAFLLIIAAAFAALLSTAGPERKTRIGILSYAGETISDNSLLELVGNWFDKDNSLEVFYRSTQADASVQAHQLESLVSEGCQVIIIDRIDFSRNEQPIINAAAAGVRLLAINADVTGGSRVYVGTNPYDEGYLMGDYLHHNLPHQASLIYITNPNSFFSQQQLQGFSESCLLFRPDVRLIIAEDVSDTAAGAVQAVDAVLRKNPGLRTAALAAPRLNTAQSVREAIIKSGRTVSVACCISSDPAVSAALTDGTVQAAVGIDQNSLAEDVYKLTSDLIRGEAVADKLYSPVLRTAENPR